MSKAKTNKYLQIPLYALFAILIANSSYLTYKYVHFYYMGGFLSPGCTDDCDSVMMSKFALLFGVPIPIYGLSYFLVLFTLYLLSQINICSKKVFEMFLILGCIAAAVFLYLLYVQLEMYCKFCTISHVSTYLLAIYYFSRKDSL